MRCDVVTQGQCCHTSGCQQITVIHLGGGRMTFVKQIKNNEIIISCDNKNSIDAKISHIDTNTNFVLDRVQGGMEVSFGLVCSTGVGGWEYLQVREGDVLLIDGQRVIVRKSKKGN